MRLVPLDENPPVQLRLWLPSVEASTAQYMGWKGLKNGELLRAATGWFEVFVTADRRLVDQQSRWVAFGIIMLSTNLKPILYREAGRIDAACRDVPIGTFVELRL